MPQDAAPPMTAATRDALHRSIARALRDEIAAGNPPVGGMLPGEHELCTRFSISRHTVREALRTLAQEGLIERRQGAGTRVLADTPRGPYLPTMHSLAELRQYAAETVLRLHAVTHAPLSPDEAASIGDGPDEEWLRVDGIRWAGEEAVCSTRVFIRSRFAPLLQDLVAGADVTGSIYDMAADRSGTQIARAEQDITAQPLPAAAARDLGLRTGAAALMFVRRYLDAGDNVMVCSLNWHPGDRYVYRMRLQRDRL